MLALGATIVDDVAANAVATVAANELEGEFEFDGWFLGGVLAPEWIQINKKKRKKNK